MRRAAERGRAVLVRSKLPHHARKATALVALHARRAHGATLGKAHGHLTNKVPAYCKWHGWRHHKHVHHGVLATVLVAATLNILLYRSAFALSDITQLWDFSSQSDYTLSDANALEYNGNSVRLKTQNYSSDVSTMALYHLDESNGTSATDSSSNGNTGTLANSPTWGTGNLNNALTLNGTNQSVSAADSSSLSLSQGNTLEAWTKLNSSFSANSSQDDQVIVDKGSYKLYYDHETGKPTYELANSSATNWTQRAGNGQNGSWNLTGPSAAKSSVVHGGSLYVGTSGGAGYGQVWRWNGSAWTKIGGDGINSGWAVNTFEEVSSLTSDGTYLYAGLGTTSGDGEVWRWNGSAWTKIGGDGINSGWAAATYESVASMTYMGGSLYAGLGTSGGDGEVWRWNGSSWTKIGGDSINSGFNIGTVVSLANDGTYVYAGTGTAAGDADVWRWDGATWTQLGGDGLNSSWAAGTYQQVLSMFVQGGQLYIGTGAGTSLGEVWKWSGSAWTRLASSGTGFPAATYEGVWSITGDGTNLYVGTGNSQNDGDVYRYNGSTWSQIGGDALSSGWTQGYIVYSLAWFNGKLYADATQASSGDVFFSWNGSAWTREGGMYYGGSWGMINLNGVRSMATANGKLYAGLAGNANASVFEYNGSTWRIIGAPGLNSAWGVSQIADINAMTSMGGSFMLVQAVVKTAMLKCGAGTEQAGVR